MSVPTVAQQQNFVKITNGVMGNKTVNGLFEWLDYNANPDSSDYPQVKIKCLGVAHWVDIRPSTTIDQVEIDGDPEMQVTQLDGKMTEAQVEKIIEERFETMDSLVRTMRDSKLVNSIIITGAAGIGKTYNITQYLDEMERSHAQHWGSIGGKCSAFGLYEALFEFRNEGSILVMDDVDVFGEEDKLNILKNALDTSPKRVIDWRSASKQLDERGLPDSFEFKGKVVFLTNTNMHAEINAGTKRAPHMSALISRSVTLDLGIHCNKTILLHVRSVIRKSNMLVDNGVSYSQQEEIITWLEKNRDNLFALSLRTPLMISELMKSNLSTWQLDARNTMLKQKSLTY